jgi:predicted TIM-barrel fold metal-dependent hydrolase
VTPAQVIPHLIFSGITERFPDLKFVFAESGIGGLIYVLATCDHEWESRHLWTEGISNRPSETVGRQIFLNFWYESAAPLLQRGGFDNIMWESDLPHIPCFYPKSWEAAERVVESVPTDARRKLLYENAARLYRLDVTEPPTSKPA